MKNRLKVIIPFVILVVMCIAGLVIILDSNNNELKDNINANQNVEKEPNLGDTTVDYDSANVKYNNSSSGLTSTKVQNAIDELASMTSNSIVYRDEICPGCVYRKSTTTKYNSNASGANGTNNKLSSSEYTTDYTTLNSNYFLGHVIDSNGYILSSYACGINNGTFFCLRGVDSNQSELTYKPFYQEGVNRMNKAFPGCNATTSGSYAECSGGVSPYVYPNGQVRLYAAGGYCFLTSAGSSFCA